MKFSWLLVVFSTLFCVADIAIADSSCDLLMNSWVKCSIKHGKKLSKKQKQYQKQRCARTQQKIIIRKCSAATTCEPTSPVCGQRSESTFPELFASECNLIASGAVKRDPAECASKRPEACADVYIPICGQSEWKCLEGSVCIMLMPLPKIYGNRCEMVRDGAYELPLTKCDQAILW